MSVDYSNDAEAAIRGFWSGAQRSAANRFQTNSKLEKNWYYIKSYIGGNGWSSPQNNKDLNRTN